MRLLFDIGGTHMRISRGETTVDEYVSIPTPGDPLAAVTALALVAKQFSGCTLAVGGVAGDVTEEGSILGANNIPAWEGFALRDVLSESLSLPVTLANDAELNGLGEALHGAGQGFSRVAYIGFGTGVGTSLIENGAVVPHSSGGALRERIVELADGSTLEERVGGAYLLKNFGPPATMSRAVWDSLTPHVVEGVRNTIEAWSPDVVVLGGSLMNANNGFRIADIEKQIGGGAVVRQGTLGDVSGLWGALSLPV
jgi:predicted NBD/HSP70 family sugar kinase